MYVAGGGLNPIHQSRQVLTHCFRHEDRPGVRTAILLSGYPGTTATRMPRRNGRIAVAKASRLVTGTCRIKAFHGNLYGSSAAARAIGYDPVHHPGGVSHHAQLRRENISREKVEDASDHERILSKRNADTAQIIPVQP